MNNTEVLVKFKDLYSNHIVSRLQQELGYTNIHSVPKIKKVVINIGLGNAVKEPKYISHALSDLSLISGQKPIITNAKKSIATFKLREGMPIGCKVTLRRQRMYEFLERLVWIALPRVKEFQGFSSKSFDKSGNFSFGLKEQVVFPEISYDRIDSIRGMDITIVTSATTWKEAKLLLESFSIPFKN